MNSIFIRLDKLESQVRTTILKVLVARVCVNVLYKNILIYESIAFKTITTTSKHKLDAMATKTPISIAIHVYNIAYMSYRIEYERILGELPQTNLPATTILALTTKQRLNNHIKASKN